MHINNWLFYTILFLLIVKLLLSYLNVELGWWLRHLTPNYEKFNPLGFPKDIQGKFEYALIPLMAFYIGSNIGKLKGLLIPFFITIILYVLNLGTAVYTGSGLLDSLNFSLKIAAPVYFYIILVIHTRHYHFSLKKLIVVFSVYCLLLTGVGLLLFDPSFNRDSMRLPVYFAGLHTHCYVLAVVFIGISLLLKKRQWALYSWMFVTLSFLVLGYNVRTAVVLYFLFIVVMLYQTNTFFKFAYAKILVYLPFALMASLVFLKDLDVDSFSSGRITMYLAKIDMLKDFSLLDFLLGRGKGSDLIRTSEWWWSKKGSHNDFLTYLVENGLPYVLAFVALLLSLITFKRRVSVFSITLIMGYLMTSALSNGLATRPIASYLFFMVLAYSISFQTKREQNA